MSRFNLKDDIRKVRVSEEEHNLMIELVYDEIQTLKQEYRDAPTPEERTYYDKEMNIAIVLLSKILPMNDEPDNSVKPFNTLENDPINNAIRKAVPDLPTDEEMQEALKRETNTRMGQAGCRGGECD